MQQQTHLTSNKIPRQPKKYGNRSCFARLKKNFILKCLTTTGVPEIRIYGEYINDTTYSDAILDRLVSVSHRVELNGASVRQMKEYGAVLKE